MKRELGEASLTLDRTVQPHPDVVDTRLEQGETVLLHMKNSAYYSLNATGSRIWEGLKQELTLQEISGCLQQEFSVQEEQANRSVLSLIEQFCAEHLVIEKGTDQAEG